MKRLAGTSMVALAVAALLASLSLVAWRQVRALEALQSLETIRRDLTLTSAEQEDLEGRIRNLESRGRVVPEAESILGMHVAEDGEWVDLPGEAS